MKIKSCKATAGVLARYAHAKLDGHFVRVIVTDSDIAFESSLGTALHLPEHVFQAADRLPAGIYLGELWTPGKPASSVKTAIKEGWRDLGITYFAIEQCCADSSLSESLLPEMELEVIHEFFNGYQQPFSPYETICEVPVQLSEAELFMYRQRARAAGMEGWMLKTGNLTGWAKLKVENTIDLVVIGFNWGKGKYEGMVGSLICGVNTFEPKLIEVADVGGMDDKTREQMTTSHEIGELLSTVVEVKYQNVDSKGRLRHPRFLRVREDKLPSECLVSQDLELEKYYNGNGLNSSADSSL